MNPGSRLVGVFPSFSSVNVFVIHILPFLTYCFFHPMELSYLSLLPGPGLVWYLTQSPSLYILSQECATDLTFISSLALGGKKRSGSRKRLNSSLQESGSCTHPQELREERSLWNRSLLWQKILHWRFQEGWVTQWLGSCSCFRYLTFWSSKPQGIKNQTLKISL